MKLNIGNLTVTAEPPKIQPTISHHFDIIQTHDAAEVLEPDQLLSYRFIAEYVSKQKKAPNPILVDKFFKNGFQKFVTYLNQTVEKSGEFIGRKELIGMKMDPIAIQAIKVCNLAFVFDMHDIRVRLLDADFLGTLIARLRRFQFHMIPTVVFHSIVCAVSCADEELSNFMLEQIDATDSLELIYSDWPDWCKELAACQDEDLTLQLLRDLWTFTSLIKRWKPGARYMHLTRRFIDNLLGAIPIPKCRGIVHNNENTPFPQIANELLKLAMNVLLGRECLRDLAVADDFVRGKMKHLDRRLSDRGQMVKIFRAAVMRLKSHKKQRIAKMHLKHDHPEVHKSLSAMEAAPERRQISSSNAGTSKTAPTSILARRLGKLFVSLKEEELNLLPPAPSGDPLLGHLRLIAQRLNAA